MERSDRPPGRVPDGFHSGRRGPDRTLLSRFENKYIVPPDMVPAMRSYLRPFLRPDEYAAERPDLTYSICSLYLDSSDYALYTSTIRGNKNRFKLRIRSYTDDPLEPVFFEIKRRMNGVILKRRAKVDREHAAALLARQSPRDLGIDATVSPDLREFLHLAATLRARPVMRVRYEREAYMSKTADPVRITFDRKLHGAPTSSFDVSFEGQVWQEAKLNGVVLEIRFTDHFPSWIGDFIGRFQLQKRSVAKYVMCVDRAGLAPQEARTPSFSRRALPSRVTMPWTK